MEEKPQIQIPRVKLGTQGLEVSRLGFGCGGLSGIYNAPLPHEAGCAVIKEAFDMGITFFDTSDLYGDNHDNEIMVGQALKQLPRERVQLATKFGILAKEGFQFEIKGTPEYVRQCCEASLTRLGIDYIDLYYQHRVDISVPIEDTVSWKSPLGLYPFVYDIVYLLFCSSYLDGCFCLELTSLWKMGELKKLVEEGKIKYIGLSEPSVDTIRRAHAVHPITALEMEYSLWSRDIENDVVPLCREVGIGMVAYSPLGRGFFGGKAVLESLPNESLLLMHPRFNSENLEKNKILYSKLSNVAYKYGCTTPQLALAWLLHQGNDIIPIPGTTKIKNLVNNIGSLNVKLTEEDLKEISDAVPIDEVGGNREFEVFSKYLYKFADTPLKKVSN